MVYLCTYFDQHYLPRALTLYRSLQEHCPAFKLWVLCMDEAAFELLTQLQLPEIYPIALADFEQNDEPLQAAKQNRSKIEYYFTCTPSLPLYIFKHWPEVDLITYLDADLFFFSSPQPLYDEMTHGSIGIIGHRFPPDKKASEKFGIYNVAWLMFRRDENAFACLQWWRERCIEWCYDRLEGDRYADQKYLDHWPTQFEGVVVLQHKGANLAPWNVEAFRLTYQQETDSVFVDEQPLIFYHYHGLKKLESWIYDPQWRRYEVVSTKVLRTKIYAPYIAVWQEVAKQLTPLLEAHARVNGIRLAKQNITDKPNTTDKGWRERLTANLQRSTHIGIRVLYGQHYVLFVNIPFIRSLTL